ncbi:MAG: endopeptidase La [Alphaproteobacteria bacterium RIFCSPHIGHO2_01_FULL_41_14]|nr:MAG: endopeptidase La [Alphaproteobacteria bacterium GWA1_45_9]OFW90299.1 MAG: endopeptidase La [Alphaproteobacteria bacterium RIFCSPHIGHO2_01_FULL_41_14]HCI48594.1 endopeptidase La [Holosporales bacterium]
MTEKINLPLLPLRDIVVFPGMVATLFVGRSKSILALESAMSLNKKIFLVAQKDSSVDEPSAKNLYKVGTVGEVTQIVNLPDGTVKVLVEGRYRARVLSIEIKEGYLRGDSAPIVSKMVDEDTLYVLDKILIKEFEEYALYNKKITPEFMSTFLGMEDYEKIVDSISVHLSLTIAERQDLLEAASLKDRLEILLFFVRRETDTLKTEEKIRDRIKSQMSKNHREYYLQEQLKAIQKELYNEDGKDEITQLEKKIKALGMPKEALEKAESELKKLRMMNPMSAEATVIRNYLEWMVDLPWKKVVWKKINLKKAKAQLDADHYGLEKVKERVLEFLAVQERLGKPKGQVLCFVGAPGVGKTSLAKSIATVMNRPFVRAALGGVRDESEIRGHRRTYIGSMPGKIIQNMKKAKATNPVFLLDEIDKMGTDWRGDPASALLEVLDPQQNANFSDHYLEVDYDLSNVTFIATANTLNLPKPLLDRMEIISIEGYTEEEKVEIAFGHLIEKQKKENGLKSSELALKREAVQDIVRYYTRESGVRNLERAIQKLARKAVCFLMTHAQKKLTITSKNLKEYLGVRRFQFGQSNAKPQLGVTTGLAWTEVGGDLLYIEAVRSRGKGKISITGKLGEVMQESVQASFSYIKSKADAFGINIDELLATDLHVHVPEGATPKDGPSAGVTITTSLVSVLTGIPVLSSVAMTGEISLRGQVLPIGGLKEKLLAAQRGGIETVLIPHENMKDLEDVPESIKSKIKVIPVETIEQVLQLALVEPLKPLVVAPKTEISFVPAPSGADFSYESPSVNHQ